jgi:hypothetical protein
MAGTLVLLAGALVVVAQHGKAAEASSVRRAAQGDRLPPPSHRKFLGIYDGDLLTPGMELHARLTEDQRKTGKGVEFWFTPNGTRKHSILIGVDRVAQEPTFGPECEGEGCFRTDEYSVTVGRALHGVPETWGRLSVRELGTREEIAAVRVYWDETPPRARIIRPQFSAPLKDPKGWKVTAKTQDENVVSIKVFWKGPPDPGGRNIPRLEQHKLGGDFAGHTACVPTSVGANLTWLNDTAQWVTWESWFNDKAVVNSLGYFMDTTTSGTSGAASVDGTVAYLDFWFGYKKGVNYNLEHLGGADFGASMTQHGFSPEQILEQFQAGGVITVGVHNLPQLPGNLFEDPPFGHAMELDNVVLNANGIASVRVMDPHLAPPADQGVYRWFILHPNGTIDWTAANPGYYNPWVSGQVALDELHIIRDYSFFQSSGADASGDASARVGTTRGEVPGKLLPGGRTWVGQFAPPPGTSDPWLLITESTDRAGRMQRDYQYVGGNRTK